MLRKNILVMFGLVLINAQAALSGAGLPKAVTYEPVSIKMSDLPKTAIGVKLTRENATYEVPWIIDWSSARAGFAQEYFCAMEHGEWLIHPASKKPFLAGYATIRPVPDYSAMMPLLRLSKALDTIGFTIKRGTWKGSGARLYQFNRRFLETF